MRERTNHNGGRIARTVVGRRVWQSRRTRRWRPAGVSMRNACIAPSGAVPREPVAATVRGWRVARPLRKICEGRGYGEGVAGTAAAPVAAAVRG
ncbi:hypothetical protein BC2230_120159 [Burkholderia cepacia]